MHDASTTIAELRAAVARFVSERAWQKFHDPKNLSMSIAIEAAELMEHFQWTRSEQLAELLQDAERRGEATDELADIACYVLAMANVLEVDLSDAVMSKLAKNARKYPPEEYQGRYSKPRD